MKIFLVSLFLFFIVSSCTSKLDHEKTLNSWIGSKESTLVEQWGTPSNFYKTDDGKKYLTWKNSSQSLIGGGYNYGYGYNYPILITSNCDITMIIEKGIVTSWRYKGNNCYDY